MSVSLVDADAAAGVPVVGAAAALLLPAALLPPPPLPLSALPCSSLICSTSSSSGVRSISGTANCAMLACRVRENRWYAIPGRTLPARPARCRALA